MVIPSARMKAESPDTWLRASLLTGLPPFLFFFGESMYARVTGNKGKTQVAPSLGNRTPNFNDP